MAIAMTPEAVSQLERSGAKVRDPKALRPVPAAPAPPQAVSMDAEPIARAMREVMGQMGDSIADALIGALSAIPAPPAPQVTIEQPSVPSAAPITGMDVQVLQRDANGGILRMKITVLR